MPLLAAYYKIEPCNQWLYMQLSHKPLINQSDPPHDFRWVLERLDTLPLMMDQFRAPNQTFLGDDSKRCFFHSVHMSGILGLPGNLGNRKELWGV